MELSIIIVSYNTETLLRQCLNSLKFEIRNSKFETEIIVVDNSSSDGSVQIYKNLKFDIENSLKIENLKLKIIENESNLGFSKAVNQGMKQTLGDAVLLLNSDTQVKPSALEKLIEFEKQVRPAIVGARMLNSDGTIQGSCFYLPTVKRAILEYWFKKKNYFSKYAPEGKEPVEVEAVSGGAMLISKEIIDKIGMLDERYFMYFEDLDYCRRAAKHGFKIYYLPSAEILHEHGASGKHLANSENQWKRLIPSSKIYHGLLRYYVIDCIIRIGQKIRKC